MAPGTDESEAGTDPASLPVAPAVPDILVGPDATARAARLDEEGREDASRSMEETAGSADPAVAPDVERVGLLKQGLRFLGTGVMSAIVDFGVLLILMALGVSYTPAKAVSFVLGTITAYSLNRRFTFKAQPSRRRFILTMLTYVLTFVLQVGIFSQVFPLLAAERLPRFAVQAISFVFGQAAATIANFAMQRWVIFRPTAGRDQ